MDMESKDAELAADGLETKPSDEMECLEDSKEESEEDSDDDSEAVMKLKSLLMKK
jgi:hypothetical protein